MPLNPIVSVIMRSKLPTHTTLAEDLMIDKLYNVNQQRYKKYKEKTKKYITMNETTNPHLNSQDNTVYSMKNECEHSKNSENLYKNNTQRTCK